MYALATILGDADAAARKGERMKAIRFLESAVAWVPQISTLLKLADLQLEVDDADGAIKTACAEACPTNAIVFGDLNDTASEVKANSKNNRSYHALEEVGIQPNIFYMTKVRNTESNEA